MKTSIRLLLLLALTFSVIGAYSQEYDDLYFNKKDRKKVKPVKVEQEAGSVVEKEPERSFLGRQYQFDESDELLSDNGVSQEAIDKYKQAIDEGYAEEVENANYSLSDQSYREPVVVNNYYMNNPSMYNSPNPWGYNRYTNRWAFGTGRNNWNQGIGFSYGSYNGWNSFGNSWYDPFWDLSYGSYWSFGFGNRRGYADYYGGGFYDPYWCPTYYGNSFYRNSFYRNAYTKRYHNGSGVANNGERNGRTVQRGGRNSRGGEVSTSGRSTQLRNVAVASQANESRNFEKTQAKYLDKSRRNIRISNSNGTNRVVRSRVSGNSVNNRSNSNASFNTRFVNGNRSINSITPVNSARQRKRTPTPSINRSSNRSSNSGSFRSSSPSKNNSGSVRSSSPSRGSSVRSYSPSRSSSVRSSSPSRSSSGRSSSGKSGSSRSRHN